MADKIYSHKELRVWQGAMETAMELFVISKSFPADARFGLTNQILRSSRAVAANIAEAWWKRRYPLAFVAKLNDAESEACETQTWIEFGNRCGYLDPVIAARLDEAYNGILAQLVVMASSPEKWVLPPSSRPSVSPSVREDQAEYVVGETVSRDFSPSPRPPVRSG